ncbi:hypothetical protein GCK72_025548 [Caenorhabditis remanei]|uniref:kynurenine--oxoglutarate transaminase n=1 Tax=Caenorhabditis remanei TaxID=31234 RepID=A0A6A5G2X0_CAERE|nr:hypothetical protein GCK72_025548 [Caenorhabditis remanei]KAF1749081.1 hypothetical protein GCK72_025548 [Caenorhabditis remanei]
MNLADGATSASQFTIDFEDMEKKINEKTKMLVINNPHNPTGKLFTRQELEKLAEIAKTHNLIVIADEVYEFHVWDKNDMVRFASLPGMYEHTISIGSAGKAFSVTGWKLGWAVGPKQLLEPLKAIHQNCVFTCSSPTQMAIAEAFRLDWPKFLNDPKNSYLATGLSGELRGKRDKLAKMLEAGNFRPIIPDAGYFMLADYSHFKEGLKLASEADPDDFVFSRWLCREKKLAVIPPSAFYSSRAEKDKNSHMVRLCYFKKNETLDAAEVILNQLSHHIYMIHIRNCVQTNSNSKVTDEHNDSDMSSGADSSYGVLSLPFDDFDIMLTDLNEAELDKIGTAEGVKHLSDAIFSNPAYPVQGIIHGVHSRMMIPLIFQHYNNIGNPSYIPFCIQEQSTRVEVLISRVGSHYEHVNLLGMNALRKLKLNMDINWDQDTFELTKK